MFFVSGMFKARVLFLSRRRHWKMCEWGNLCTRTYSDTPEFASNLSHSCIAAESGPVSFITYSLIVALRTLLVDTRV